LSDLFFGTGLFEGGLNLDLSFELFDFGFVSGWG
jgi:hypothetical protein